MGCLLSRRLLTLSGKKKPTKNNGMLLYSIVTMEYTMYAQDGSSITGQPVGEGMDSGDKASNKAMAVALKYFLLQTSVSRQRTQKTRTRIVHTVAATPVHCKNLIRFGRPRPRALYQGSQHSQDDPEGTTG